MATVTTPDNPGGMKRSRGTPTMLTPRPPRKRAVRRLTFADQEDRDRADYNTWSEDEVKALVEFVLFHSNTKAWPSHNHQSFWSNAAVYVKHRSSSTCKRSGKSFVA